MSNKHRKTIKKYSGTLKELANDIGDLHYDSLQDFLINLSDKLRNDSTKDGLNGRIKLASELAMASIQVGDAAFSISKAWAISKPHMKG